MLDASDNSWLPSLRPRTRAIHAMHVQLSTLFINCASEKCDDMRVGSHRESSTPLRWLLMKSDWLKTAEYFRPPNVTAFPLAAASCCSASSVVSLRSSSSFWPASPAEAEAHRRSHRRGAVRCGAARCGWQLVTLTIPGAPFLMAVWNSFLPLIFATVLLWMQQCYSPWAGDGGRYRDDAETPVVACGISLRWGAVETLPYLATPRPPWWQTSLQCYSLAKKGEV